MDLQRVARRRGARVSEDDVQINSRIGDALYRRLRIHCIEHDVTMQAFIEHAIAERLAFEENGHRGTR